MISDQIVIAWTFVQDSLYVYRMSSKCSFIILCDDIIITESCFEATDCLVFVDIVQSILNVYTSCTYTCDQTY